MSNFFLRFQIEFVWKKFSVVLMLNLQNHGCLTLDNLRKKKKLKLLKQETQKKETNIKNIKNIEKVFYSICLFKENFLFFFMFSSSFFLKSHHFFIRFFSHLNNFATIFIFLHLLFSYADFSDTLLLYYFSSSFFASVFFPHFTYISKCFTEKKMELFFAFFSPSLITYSHIHPHMSPSPLPTHHLTRSREGKYANINKQTRKKGYNRSPRLLSSTRWALLMETKENFRWNNFAPTHTAPPEKRRNYNWSMRFMENR